MPVKNIHPTAVIENSATIGEGTNIWHFSHIMPKAIIGNHCNIGQNVFVDNYAIIGNHVKIQNNVSIYNNVQLQDDVFIGPSAVFTNVTNPRSFIERKNELKATLVKKGATIGANATIVCGIIIGEYAMIGAGSVVTKDVLPNALMIGNPAIQKGWVSEAGNTLKFDKNNEAICSHSNHKYLLKDNRVVKI
jgi:UDP-2-acetamido-3-amino-2,3-dideoxy-glucuronate N-acetyltransferase